MTNAAPETDWLDLLRCNPKLCNPCPTSKSSRGVVDLKSDVRSSNWEPSTLPSGGVPQLNQQPKKKALPDAIPPQKNMETVEDYVSEALSMLASAILVQSPVTRTQQNGKKAADKSSSHNDGRGTDTSHGGRGRSADQHDDMGRDRSSSREWGGSSPHRRRRSHTAKDMAMDFERRVSITRNFEYQVSLHKRKAFSFEAARLQSHQAYLKHKVGVSCLENDDLTKPPRL